MRTALFASAFTASLLSLLATCGQAENWPGWRGPQGDGSSRDPAPTVWDGASGENVVWKTAISGKGHGSPIVYGDKIFVATCIDEEKRRVLLCLDRRTGDKLWEQTVVQAPLETKHALNSFASGTPATDGKLVYVSFLEVDGRSVPARNVSRVRPVTPGKMVVAAYDTDGAKKWVAKPGEFVSVHGYCSNPVIYKDLLIVNGDHDGDSYIVALNRFTGKTVWKEMRKHKTRSYVTPLIREIDGKTQMVVSGSKCIVSFDPLTGARNWEISGPTEQYVASMVYDGKFFFMAAGFPTHHVMAIRPNGRGDVTKSHVAWHAKNARCYVPSPIVENGYLLVADDRGTANCFDASSGKRFWQARLGNHFSASLVKANGLVYFTADDGVTKVVRPADDLEIVAENKLGENSFASPAISNGQIFIRGVRHLFCIGAK